MINVTDLVEWVRNESVLQESHWLEWKSMADLGQRVWQARVARFVLGAANRPRSLTGPHEGQAFMLLGVEPGQAHGTNAVDPAQVGQGLARYLGIVGPQYSLDYATIDGLVVAVLTVPPSSAGSRPYLARGTFSGERLEIQDGRIYVRRSGTTTEATSDEVDEMLAERVATRVAAGPLWPMQAEPAWRDGNEIHVRRQRGDKIMIHDVDNFTNLAEMAQTRPNLPSPLPSAIAERISIFDSLADLADAEPYRAVQEAWPPLRGTAIEAYERSFGPLPFDGFKVVDILHHLASERFVDPGWVNVAYPLYYWPLDESAESLSATPGLARTYVLLAKSLAAALLLTEEPTNPQREQRDDAT
jgi:hypothetical protein